MQPWVVPRSARSCPMSPVPPCLAEMCKSPAWDMPTSLVHMGKSYCHASQKTFIFTHSKKGETRYTIIQRNKPATPEQPHTCGHMLACKGACKVHRQATAGSPRCTLWSAHNNTEFRTWNTGVQVQARAKMQADQWHLRDRHVRTDYGRGLWPHRGLAPFLVISDPSWSVLVPQDQF